MEGRIWKVTQKGNYSGPGACGAPKFCSVFLENLSENLRSFDLRIGFSVSPTSRVDHSAHILPICETRCHESPFFL